MDRSRNLTLILGLALLAMFPVQAHTQEPLAGCTSNVLDISAQHLLVCDDRDNQLCVDDLCWQVIEWSTGEFSECITVNTTGSFWVTARHRDLGIIQSDTITISRSEGPKPIIGNPIEYLCLGDEARLQAPTTMASYLWSTGDTTNEIRVTEAGTYWLEVVDSNGCFGRSDEIEIIVIDLPEPELGGPNSACRNSSVVYTVAPLPNSSYVWTVDGGTIQSGDGTNTIEVEWTRNGRLEVQVIQERPDGGTCVGVAGMFITVGDKLNPEILYQRSSLCVGDTIILEAPAGYASYKWSTGETGRFIRVGAGGMYWVEVEDSSGCQGISDSLRVREYERPSASIIGPRAICGDGQTITLQGVDALGDIVLWDWSTGASTKDIVVSTPGTYTLIAWNLNGCTDTTSFTVSQATALDVDVAPADFGIVDIGTTNVRQLSVTNNSTVDISVLEILGVPADMTLTPIPPRLIPVGRTEYFDVEWITSAVGTFANVATLVVTSSECADTVQTSITGTVVNPDTTGSVTITAVDTTIAVGTPLDFPLHFDASVPFGSTASIQFTITLQNSVFLVEDIQGAQVLRDDVVGTTRSIRLLVDSDTDLRQLIVLRGQTLLASPFMTSVEIDDIDITSNAPFVSNEEGGSVTLTGCWLPGRLIEHDALQLTRRWFTIDGREVHENSTCKPCLEVYFDTNGRPVGSYLINSISR